MKIISFFLELFDGVNFISDMVTENIYLQIGLFIAIGIQAVDIVLAFQDKHPDSDSKSDRY